MNDKYKEIGAGLAVIGSIVYAFHLFMDWTGIPSDLGANFGIAVKDLFWVASVILLIAATARFLHYYGIAGAGANPIGTGPREKYDALRKSLAAHEDAKDGYARRLKAFLTKVDAFFGDADMANQRFFLLREQAALWTAPAFDCCLFLALFYPVAAIFVIWAVSGEVGPAERALGLNAAGGPQRLVALLIAAGFLPFWRLLRRSRLWWRLAWLIAAFASAVALTVASALAIALLALAGVLAVSAFDFAGAGAGALVLVFTGIFSGAITVPAFFAFTFAGGVAAAITCFVGILAAGVSVGVGLALSLAICRPEGETNSWPLSSRACFSPVWPPLDTCRLFPPGIGKARCCCSWAC